jgi:hypothetical protein
MRWQIDLLVARAAASEKVKEFDDRNKFHQRKRGKLQKPTKYKVRTLLKKAIYTGIV